LVSKRGRTGRRELFGLCLEFARDVLKGGGGVQVTEVVVARADTLAWDHGLRGYDAVHLAAASIWQDALGERVTLVTFDRRLWTAAEAVGLDAYPVDLPIMLEMWKAARKSS
jgi:predicted nucleic acid-binding protein